MQVENLTKNSGTLTANIVDIASRRIYRGEIRWRHGKIESMTELGAEKPALGYLLPGFVDAHVHIESSLLTPCEFARIAVRHGTVACVSDPHEIANVLGVAGVQFMLDNAQHTPFKFLFGAPSCVPATPFETAGAEIGLAQLERLLNQPGIGYLAEMMNYPAILSDEPQALAKLALAQRYGTPIDGHAPDLTGIDALRYAQAGISTDHECSTLDEANDKLAAGMHILIREGSAACNFAALHPLIDRCPDKVMLCSDDKHPDDLLVGHINTLASRAVALGHDVFNVLQCACVNPVRHYRLPLGQLHPGEPMDAMLVNNLHDFIALKTWIEGQLTAERGQSLLPSVTPLLPNRFNAGEITPSDLDIAYRGGKLRVIQALDGELLTRELLCEPAVVEKKIVPDLTRDILLLTVVNRYKPGKPAVAFIHGFGLHEGALASSVAHDSHNIIAVGADAHSLCSAVNGIIRQHGGIAAVRPGQLELLPLPVVGLMSDADGDSVGERYAELDRLAKRMGSPLRAPFMTLSFMALLVIPELKLSDRGLFDGRSFSFTELTV